MDERPTIIDNEHLKLLRIGYIVLASTNLLAVAIGLLYAFIGFVFGSLMTLSDVDADAEFAAVFPMIMLFIGIGIALFVGALVTLQFLTAKYLRERRNRTLCTVTAAISCLSMPWGTAIGVCTFYVLNRASVKQEFEQ